MIALAAASSADVAHAIKWAHGCPQPTTRLISAGGRLFTTSPFIHPGHEIAFFLKEREASRRGGFSIEPEGNRVEIVFMPFGGPPIPLPPIHVAAVSPTALYFDFPDTREVLGRVVAGPMLITIRGPGFVRRAHRPVALPPGNDVRALIEQGVETPAFAAMDTARRLWVPLEFAGFGPGMPMPSCPVPLTQKMAFAVGMGLKQPDIDEVIPHGSFTNFRLGKFHFGDFLLNGVNAYGQDTRSTLDVRTLTGGGVVLCGMNDALSLVLRLRLQESAIGPGSRILPIVRDGSPLPLQLTDISAEPVVAQQLQNIKQDSFGNECLVAP